MYDHDTYVETLSGEEYTVALNGTATYEVPSENIEYLDEEKSVLSARALANDKTVLKVVYNKTNHTPSSYSYNKGENPMWTCACGHEESMTAQAYRDYVANIYSFNSEDSKDLLTFAGDNAETAFNNTVYADGKLTNVSISTTAGTYSALTIDLGGFYKVEDIVNVTVNITVDTAGTNDDWLDATLNHAGTITDDAKLTRPAVSGSSYKTAKVTETGELSLVIEQANILMNSAFTENTVLNTLTLGFASASKSVVISIDSIEFVTETELIENMNSIYDFNDESCLNLMSFGGSSASTVKSGIAYENGKITNVKIGTTSGCYCYANISLGGIFTVADLESITVNIETDVNTSTANDYIDVLLNHSSFNNNASTANRPTSGTTRVNFTRKAGKISVTFTMANTGLTENTTLDKLSFAFSSGGKSALTFSIDSIVFNLAN